MSILPKIALSSDLTTAFTQSYIAPVSFVNTLLAEAVTMNSSDILLEPIEDTIRVRVRIDGVLYELGKIPSAPYEQIVARLKVMGKLDSTEKRRIQEGQITLVVHNKTVNLRLEIVQAIHGEIVVIRVHEKSTIVLDLSALGLSEVAYKKYLGILKKNHGLVLVCGPTGCGKSTTLYSTISYLNRDQNYNVMTIEDPVEFQLPGVNQMQTNEEFGFTFAEGLKSILRLTPDIILVGEIRDKETAGIAIESGLTGQLVLSTIHAQDAIGTLYRLLDIGIESYFINSSVSGIVAQRLVRKICKNCKTAYAPSTEEIDLFYATLGRKPTQLFKGEGCSECKNIGYHGRTATFEVLVMSTKVRDLIRNKVAEDALRSELINSHELDTLLMDGLAKSEQGITTIDEVWRNSLLN